MDFTEEQRELSEFLKAIDIANTHIENGKGSFYRAIKYDYRLNAFRFSSGNYSSSEIKKGSRYSDSFYVFPNNDFWDLTRKLKDERETQAGAFWSTGFRVQEEHDWDKEQNPVKEDYGVIISRGNISLSLKLNPKNIFTNYHLHSIPEKKPVILITKEEIPESRIREIILGWSEKE